MKEKIMKSKKGFTLVEVLIVVIIIGILSSLAIPMYKRATEHARIAEATQILSQVRTAEEVYKLKNGSYTDAFADLIVDIPADGDTLFNYSLTIAGGVNGFKATAARNTNDGGVTAVPTVTLDGSGNLTETW